MIEKFNDFESNFINEEGTYKFTISDYELKEGNVAPMAMFTFKADEGLMKRGFSLSEKARWRYNQLIAAALKLTKEQRRTYELDYETIGQELVGKQFYGVVEYKEVPRIVRTPDEDGIITEKTEIKSFYEIVTIEPVED